MVFWISLLKATWRHNPDDSNPTSTSANTYLVSDVVFYTFIMKLAYFAPLTMPDYAHCLKLYTYK